MSLRIDQQEVTKNNIGQVRALLEATIPVKYSDTFFSDLCAHFPKDNRLVRLGYHNEALVCVITGRRETYDPENVSIVGRVHSAKEDADIRESKTVPEGEHHRVYISTLAVLSAYRRRGAAAGLFKSMMEFLETDTTVEQVYIHVHVSNTAAIALYEANGFVKAAVLEGYYKVGVVSPPDAIVYIKNLRQ